MIIYQKIDSSIFNNLFCNIISGLNLFSMKMWGNKCHSVKLAETLTQHISNFTAFSIFFSMPLYIEYRRQYYNQKRVLLNGTRISPVSLSVSVVVCTLSIHLRSSCWSLCIWFADLLYFTICEPFRSSCSLFLFALFVSLHFVLFSILFL